MKEERAEIVKSGTFFYDNKVQYEVGIVKQNFEFCFEEDYDDKERLNDNGETFRVLYLKANEVVSGGSEFFTLDEAIAGAN